MTAHRQIHLDFHTCIGDAVFINQHIATIHAISSGKKNLRLLGPSKVTDLTSGKVINESTDQIELDMQQATTRWFFLEPTAKK